MRSLSGRKSRRSRTRKTKKIRKTRKNKTHRRKLRGGGQQVQYLKGEFEKLTGSSLNRDNLLDILQKTNKKKYAQAKKILFQMYGRDSGWLPDWVDEALKAEDARRRGSRSRDRRRDKREKDVGERLMAMKQDRKRGEDELARLLGKKERAEEGSGMDELTPSAMSRAMVGDEYEAAAEPGGRIGPDGLLEVQCSECERVYRGRGAWDKLHSHWFIRHETKWCRNCKVAILRNEGSPCWNVSICDDCCRDLGLWEKEREEREETKGEPRKMTEKEKMSQDLKEHKTARRIREGLQPPLFPPLRTNTGSAAPQPQPETEQEQLEYGANAPDIAADNMARIISEL